MRVSMILIFQIILKSSESGSIGVMNLKNAQKIHALGSLLGAVLAVPPPARRRACCCLACLVTLDPPAVLTCLACHSHGLPCFKLPGAPSCLPATASLGARHRRGAAGQVRRAGRQGPTAAPTPATGAAYWRATGATPHRQLAPLSSRHHRRWRCQAECGEAGPPPFIRPPPRRPRPRWTGQHCVALQ